MAKIILGLGTSHSPMLSTPAEMWPLHAQRDQQNPRLHFRGRVYNFKELRQARASERLERHVSGEIWRSKEQGSRQAIVALGERLADAAPDVVVIIGDDQHELFYDDNMPALAIFWGERIECIPPVGKPAHPSIAQARRDQFGDEPEWYPVASELGRHLVEQTVADGFDVTQFTRQAGGRTIGHAFSFVRRRLMKGKLLPIVPVAVNTYYPPNQPAAARCYAYGRALRRAVESWDGAKRVAIVASGGLSHFVVDEELDDTVLKAMRERDEQTVGCLGQELLQSGSSEIKNWIVAAGALEGLTMNAIGYFPAYRSEAGTGCGLAFAEWL
jgi:3-O-methylgallate 3,4-dioxygenase